MAKKRSFRVKPAQFSEQIKNLLEKPILTSFLVLIAMAVLVIGTTLVFFTYDEEFVAQIMAEAHGMLFDIAVIGILILWLNRNGERRQRIRTYKDEIDDFRLWESEEAAFRTVGNIKRLNRHGIYEINLVKSHLNKTNLNYVNLSGSNMNNAQLTHANLIEVNFESTRLNQTNLENANLNQANLSNAFATGANFRDAFLIKASMENTQLIAADFRNAFLMEANLQGAYLTDANFEDANLYQADLRGAIGLTVDQLSKVKTLYMAQFDEEIKKQIEKEYPSLLGS